MSVTQTPTKVLFIGHEASRTGAPIGFLSLIRWLQEAGAVEPVLWLRHGGDLVAEHVALGRTAVGTDAAVLANVEGIQLAYLNTATLGAHTEALKLAGVPVICHAHEMDFELNVTGRANLERLEKGVRLFVACSEAVKASLIRCAGVEAEKVVVVPECVDVERALRRAEQPTAMQVREPGKRVVCGMGTVSWRKGVDLFLRVVAELGEGWRGVWIGDLESGPDADRVRHDLRVLGLEQKVVFTGSLPNPHAVLCQADVFCLTSREDPYPLAMVEAAALGKPVIGFAGSGGVEEFAMQGGAYTVAYADTHAMARLVEELAEAGPDAGRLAAARRLCHPDVVGAAVRACLEQVALAKPMAFSSELKERLATACAMPMRAEVTMKRPGSEAVLTAWWEGPANGQGQVELLTGEGEGEGETEASEQAFEMVLAPTGRSVVVSEVSVRFQTPQTLHGECAIQMRSAGRVARLSKVGGGVWLLLDGQGRIVIQGKGCPSGACVVLTWTMSTDVKRAVAAITEGSPPQVAAPAAQRGLLGRLGLKRDTD
jgi:glycosyltransferase involved in cell wall biosynthesis